MKEPASTKGERIRGFFEIEADVLYRRFRVLQTLLPNETTQGAAHRGEEGRHIEALLRDFLNRHLPSDLRAVSGFIVRPATKTGASDYERVESETDSHSAQLDVIVYDLAHYPVYEHFEEFGVFPPEGVIAVISVKKTLRKPDVAKEIRALAHAAELCRCPGQRGPHLGLFAFQSPATNLSADSVFESARHELGNRAFDSMLNEITVLDRYVIFKLRPDHSPSRTARYVNIDCTAKMHISLQRLIQSILSVYYDPSRGKTRERPGFVSFEKGTFRNAPVLGDVPTSGQ